MRRRGTRRPSPQRMAARTCADYAVRTGTPCTPARSCRRNNGCSWRTGITATRWRRAPVRVTSSSRRLARVVPRVKASRIGRAGAHASHPVVAGFVVPKSIVGIDLPIDRRTLDPPPKRERGPRPISVTPTGTKCDHAPARLGRGSGYSTCGLQREADAGAARERDCNGTLRTGTESTIGDRGALASCVTIVSERWCRLTPRSAT